MNFFTYDIHIWEEITSVSLLYEYKCLSSYSTNLFLLLLLYNFDLKHKNRYFKTGRIVEIM